MHDEVLVPADDTAFALRLARYCARNPAALERLEYHGRHGTHGRSADDVPVPVAERPPLTLTDARRRWAELLRRIFEVDPLRCPTCSAEMRIVAVITERAVRGAVLESLATRAKFPALSET